MYWMIDVTLSGELFVADHTGTLCQVSDATTRFASAEDCSATLEIVRRRHPGATAEASRKNY